MGTFHRFEDIQAWQNAREISRQVYRLTSGGAFARDFGLRDQIRRAAVSVMANIAEGFGRGGNRKFSQFLGHSRGSIAELKSHLYVALDAGLLVQADFEDLFAAATKTESQVSALIGYLAKTEHRGPRLRKNREP